MRCLIVIEPTASGYSAHSPDLDGCVAVGATRDEVDTNFREAIEFHVEGMRQEGLAVPAPSSYSTYVDIHA